MIRLSVIIPCFNSRATLPRALGALAAQTVPEGTFEVVIVDDGSTDGTADVVREHRLPGPVRVVRQENRGLASARNLGAAQARSEILLYLDPDVFADPGLVEGHLRHYRHGDALLAVQGRTATDPATVVTPFMRATTLMPDLTVRRSRALSPFHVVGRNFSITVAGWRAAGRYDEDFVGYGWEDIEFAVRFTRAGGRIHFEPEAFGLHHHPLTIEQAVRRQRQNGAAAAYFWRKHGRAGTIGLMLEVHPALLPLKWLVYRTGLLGRAARAILPWAERGEHVWVCNECYNYLLWEAYYTGVFEALRTR